MKFRHRSLLRGVQVLFAACMVLGFGLVFSAPASASTVPANRGFQEIKNAGRHQYCMDIKTQDNAGANDARLQLWSCSGASEQSFQITYVGDIYGLADLYQVKVKRSNKCLDVVSLVWPAPQMVQYTCQTAQSQNFFFRPTGEIVSQLTGNCLEPTGDVRGAMVLQVPCNGSIPQRWFW